MWSGNYIVVSKENFRRVGAWIEVVSSGDRGYEVFRIAVSSDRGVGF